MDVFSIHLKIFVDGNISKLLQVLCDLLSDLIPMLFLSQWFDRFDLGKFHHEFHIDIQPWIWGLKFGNEWGKMFFLLDEHLNLFFFQLFPLNFLYYASSCLLLPSSYNLVLPSATIVLPATSFPSLFLFLEALWKWLDPLSSCVFDLLMGYVQPSCYPFMHWWSQMIVLILLC